MSTENTLKGKSVSNVEEKNDRFGNLNLNESNKRPSFLSTNESISASSPIGIVKYSSDLRDELRSSSSRLLEKKGSNSYLANAVHNENGESEQLYSRKGRRGSSPNTSTLSLHIKSYEESGSNCGDKAVEDTVAVKENDTESPSFLLQNRPFDFQRQHETTFSTPKTMRYKSNQKMNNFATVDNQKQNGRKRKHSDSAKKLSSSAISAGGSPIPGPSNCSTSSLDHSLHGSPAAAFETPKFRLSYKTTKTANHRRNAALIKHALDGYNEADEETKRAKFKAAATEKLQIADELERTQRLLAKALKQNCSKETESEGIQTEMILVAHQAVQTIDENVVETSILSAKPSTEVMQRPVHKKNFLDLTSRQSILDRKKEGLEIITQLAAPSLTPDSDKTESNRNAFVVEIASACGLKIEKKVEITPLKASLMITDCRLTQRTFLKLKKYLEDYVILPSRYAMDLNVKKFDDLFEVSTRHIYYENERLAVTTLDTIEECLQFKLQNQVDHGTFQEGFPPFQDTIFGGVAIDKGGKAVRLCLSVSSSLFPNSPEGVIFLGTYNGPMKAMGAAFRFVCQNLKRIKSVRVKLNDQWKSYNFALRFISDIEGILEGHGRKPASSNVYCWKCDYIRPKNRTFSNPEAIKLGEPRITFHEGDGGYVREPYFSTRPNEIAFPCLHIWQGLFNDKLNEMEEVLKILDYKELSEEDKLKIDEELAVAHSKIKKLQQSLEIATGTMQGLEENLYFLEHLLDNEVVSTPNNGLGGGCAASYCVCRSGYEVDVVMKECSCCAIPKQYHNFCIGAQGDSSSIKCRDVREYLRNNGLKSYLETLLSKAQEDYRKAVVAFTEAETKLQKAIASKKNVSRDNMRQFYGILNSMGVSQNSYYGTYNGNQARIVMTQTEKFNELDAAKTAERLQHIIASLQKLGSLQNYTVASYLNEKQIEEFKDGIEDYIKYMSLHLGDTNVTPKNHLLLHLHEFAATYKTLGLLSEQSIEALHALVKFLYPRASFLKKDDRDQWIMKQIWRISCFRDMSKKLK